MLTAPPSVYAGQLPPAGHRLDLRLRRRLRGQRPTVLWNHRTGESRTTEQNLQHSPTEALLCLHPQELMVLSSVSDFYTWTTVSLVGSAGLEVQVQVQKSTSISYFQDSGQSSYLTQQNLTLLVPSSDAVAKMSYDDKSFWTTAGNLATLVRSGLDLRTFP